MAKVKRKKDSNSSPKIVEAQAFVLQDTRGQIKALLGLTKDEQPALKLVGANGCSINVGFVDEGKIPTVLLSHTGAKVRLKLSVSEQSGAFVAITDEDGNDRVLRSSDPDDGDGKEVVSFPEEKENTSSDVAKPDNDVKVE